MAEAHWKKHILPILPAPLREALGRVDEGTLSCIEEIRLRAGKPVMLQAGQKQVCLAGVPITSGTDLHRVLLLIAEHSLYARDEELRRGYLALPGGHRAGFVGRAVVENNSVRLLRDISGINIRIAREVKEAARPLLPHIYCPQEKSVCHTLLVSAPQAGKTTMLRDLARLLANGDPAEARPAFKVAIVDERSEIAGCYAGVPQLDVGLQADVLDGCPKAEGMMMVVRSMSPQVVVTDELGRPEDVRAVEEAINTGVAVVASAHGRSIVELMARPSFAYLFANKLFERIILLSRRKGPGTIEEVIATGTSSGRRGGGMSGVG